MVRGYNRVPYVKPQTDTRRIHFVHQISENTSLKSPPDTVTRVSYTESHYNHKSAIALQQLKRADTAQQPAKKARTNECRQQVFSSIFRIPQIFQKFHDRPIGRLTLNMMWGETRQFKFIRKRSHTCLSNAGTSGKLLIGSLWPSKLPTMQTTLFMAKVTRCSCCTEWKLMVKKCACRTHFSTKKSQPKSMHVSQIQIEASF